ILIGVFFWNLAEWINIRAEKEGGAVLGMSLSLLPALYFHLALQLGVRGRARTRWLVLGYGCALAFFLPALSSIWHAPTKEFYDAPDGWDVSYVIVFAPLLVAGSLLLVRRAFSEPRGNRGIFLFPVVALLVMAPLGMWELANQDAPKLANVGAVGLCLVITWGVLHYGVVFDAITRLRQSTSEALDAMQRGLVTFDHKGAVLFCNDSATALLGVRPARIEDLEAAIQEVVQNGGNRFVKRGSRILKVSASRPDVPVESAASIQLLLEDNTHEYELLHELSHRESLASLGEAAATLAHEIRNPLAAIGSTVDTLSSEAKPSKEQLELLTGQLERLNSLVARSLDLARPIKVKPEPSDFNALLERIAARVPPPMRVRLELAEKLREVSIDPDLIGQVFDNLIRNAAEAGANEVTVVTRQGEGVVVAVVRNPGPPIPPEVIGRLFQPFVTTKATGAGVGLAFCKKILTAHGGDISAANFDGGVEFEMRLPCMS
ncbi:MAG: ATP-binding protein, partial [Planctomycetota bacterium]|nr:ATP-binding protein [Planctomycetota bacterium]